VIFNGLLSRGQRAEGREKDVKRKESLSKIWVGVQHFEPFLKFTNANFNLNDQYSVMTVERVSAGRKVVHLHQFEIYLPSLPTEITSP